MSFTATFKPAVTQKFLGLGQMFTNLLRHNYVDTSESDTSNAYRNWEVKLAHSIGALIRDDSLNVETKTGQIPSTAYETRLKKSEYLNGRWISAIRVQLVNAGTRTTTPEGIVVPVGDGADWQFRIETYNAAHPVIEYYQLDTAGDFKTFNALKGQSTKLAWNHYSTNTILVNQVTPFVVTGVQNLVNVLFGYVHRLDELGFKINYSEEVITDDETGRNVDWQLEIEKLVDRIYRDLGPGQGHILNPFMHALWVETPLGLLSKFATVNFADIAGSQAIFDVNGDVIPVNTLDVVRTDEKTVVYSDTPIFSAHVFIDEYEHVIVFNDLISEDSGIFMFEPFLGIRTGSAYLTYTRQEDITRRPHFPGFILLGDGIKRNIVSSVDAISKYYDPARTFDESTTADHALAVLGFNKKDYFGNLNASPATQFNFWRGLIQAKGTNMTIDAFVNYKKFTNAEVDEYWAYKLAEYGDARRRDFPEVKIEVADCLQKFTQLQFFDSTDNLYKGLPLFTQIEATDDSRWFTIDDLGNQLTFRAQPIEAVLPGTVPGYYALPDIFHNGDDAAPKIYLRTITDGSATDKELTESAAKMVTADMVKVITAAPKSNVVTTAAFSYPEESPVYTRIGAINQNGTAFRFATNKSSTSPDGNFMIVGNSNIVLTPLGAMEQETLESASFTSSSTPRMTPKYFTVDGPRSMSFALTTSGSNLTVNFTARMKNDLCGIIWSSEDTKDHNLLKYGTNRDYRNMVWDFDLEVSSTCPLINDPTKAIGLTIEGRDNLGHAVSYIVPLFRYATTPASRSSHITIDFNTVRAGFFADQPTYVGDVDRMFISAITSSYDGTVTALSLPEQGYIKLSNCSVSGPNAWMTVGIGNVPAHSLGMCTSYDDSYDQSPERIVDNIWGLGYRGWINHYVGMSVFPEKTWNGVDRLVVVDATSTVVNQPTKTWHTDFATRLNAKGYKLIQAVSYETFSENARYEWTQRDINDNFGQTGYTPPSYLLSHCNTDAMAWLKKAFVEFATVANSVGAPIYIQVGEPWWWTNPGTKLPCVYDFPTRLKFNAETGLFAPDIGTVDSVQINATPYTEFRAFLKKELGLSVQSMRTAVKTAFPSAKVSTMPFLPTILDGGVMADINLPSDYYAYPNFDFFQTEAYDWIIDDKMTKLTQAMTYPIYTLGYPPDLVHYLGGFAPDADTSTERHQVWKRVFKNLHDNEVYNIAKQYIWAYPLVMRDSITYREASNYSSNLRSFFSDGAYAQIFPIGANDYTQLPNGFNYTIESQATDGKWYATLNVSITVNPIDGETGPRSFASYTTTISPSTYEYVVKGYTWVNQTKISPVKLFDYIEDTLVQEIGLWHPAIGIHANEALDVVNSISVMDPALYNVTGQTTNNPNYVPLKSWGKKEVGRVWWDISNLGYIPYYDAMIFPDRNERHARWGNLAEWASVDLYEWVESDVPPNEYDALATDQQGQTDIDAAARASGTAARKQIYSRNRIISVKPIAWSHAGVGNSAAHPAFGPAYSQRVRLVGGALYIESGRTADVGLSADRRFGAWKNNIPVGESIIGADQVYDLGSAVNLSVPDTISSGIIGRLEARIIPDGRLGNYIGQITLTSRVDQTDTATFTQYLRMADAFGHYQDVVIDDWFADSEDDRTIRFADFGIDIYVERTDSSAIYSANDFCEDVVNSWSDVYIREGITCTEFIPLPDTIFINDDADPDTSIYEYGWKTWDIPTKAELAADLNSPFNSWLPYLGTSTIVQATASVVAAMADDTLTLKSGIPVKRYSSAWSDWSPLDDIRIQKISDGSALISINRSEFLPTTDKLDKNRVSVYANGILLNTTNYSFLGDVGAESIQVVNILPEGTTVLFIYRAYQPTKVELSFDPDVKDDPSIQTQYKADYQYTKIDVRGENGTFIGSKYYFWVEDSTVVRPNKSKSIESAKDLLTNGQPQFALFERIYNEEYDSVVIAGLNYLVTNNDTYKLRFANNETLRDDPEQLNLKNVHTEWALMRRSQNSKVPLKLWQQLTDAAAGQDAGGNPVPSPIRADYDARHGTRTRFGFKPGQILADTDLVRATITNTILNTSLVLRIGSSQMPDYITALNFDESDTWFETADSARATMDLIWNSARARQINEIFFEVLEDALANNYEFSDIFKTSLISLNATSRVEQKSEGELEDSKF
jgi:hypothetical protein